ncbi:MAG: FxLYD domain-containing protein [Ethanoligenens sp.]
MNESAQAAAAGQGPTVIVQKKKGKGCLIAALVVVAIVVIIIIAVVAGTYHVAKTVENNTVGMVSGSSWTDKFDVSDLTLSAPDNIGVQYAEGTITNKTSKPYSYLQVEINEYDASGAQVGSTLANVSNLEAKGTWKFKASITDQNVKSVKLKGVSGFSTAS